MNELRNIRTTSIRRSAKKAGFLLVLAFLSSSTFAQLSGTYTIATSGAPDYPTFSAAMTAMVDNGVNGDLVFEIEEGIYQERVVMNFNEVTFSSTSISVSFIGQGASPENVWLISQSTSASTDYTLQVNGGQNILFQNMKFQNSGLVYANVVAVGLGASVSGITFDNCHFQGTTAFIENTFPTSIYFESGTSDITVTNTIHRGSNYGITCWSGTSDVLIQDNELYEQHVQAMSLSVSVATIEGNYIEKQTDAADQYNYGIELWQANDFIVRSNEFVLDHSKIAGLALNDDFVVANTYNLVEQNTLTFSDLNNGIRVSGSSNSLLRNNFGSFQDVKFGVFLSDADNTNVVQNTFKMDSDGDILVVVSGDDINSYNNVMINYGEGTVYASLTAFASDYNLVHTEGEEFSSDDDTFELHQEKSGQDANSTSLLLDFPIATSPEVCHYAVSDAGLDLGTLTADGSSLADLDYFGSSRNNTFPDIGAYEFELPTTPIFSSDTLAICLGDMVTLEPESVFSEYLWLGDSSTENSITVPEDSMIYIQVVDVLGCILLDSIYVKTQFVEVDLGEDLVLCVGNSLTLDAGEGFHAYQWSTGETTSSIEISAEGTYSVVVNDELGCSATDELVVSLAELELIPNFLMSGIGCTSDTIQFVEVSNLLPDSVFWDFGDRTSSVEQHPNHIYASVGEYEVSMIAHLGGCSLEMQKDLVITSTCADYLIAYYPLDTAANDISDNEFDGLLQGGVTFVDDRERGRVAFFDGVDDHIELTTSGALDLVNRSFTVSAWVKTLKEEGSNPILGTNVEEDNQGLNLGLLDNETYLSFFNNDVSGRQKIDLEEWHFVTWSYDVDLGEKRIYVDGELDVAVAEKEAFASFVVVAIGLAQSTSFFSGYIDDLRIWKDALTEEEIFENWSGYSSELRMHFAFEDDFLDSSGNGFAGTASGTTTTQEDEDRGSVALFNLEDDWVSGASYSDLGITDGSFSISTWYKDLDATIHDGIYGGSGLEVEVVAGVPQMSYAGAACTASIVLESNRWYHLRYNFLKSSGKMEIYVNGNLVGESEGNEPFSSNDGWGQLGYLNPERMTALLDDFKIRILDDNEGGRLGDVVEETAVFERHEMVVYPNPSHGEVNFELENIGEYKGTILLYDSRGNLLRKIPISGEGIVRNSMQLYDLEPGMYFVKMQIRDQHRVGRLLIKSR